MYAVCPNSPDHRTFVTSAHVVQDWKVDARGEFVEELASVEVAHGPDVGNEWTCATCDAVAEVRDGAPAG